MSQQPNAVPQPHQRVPVPAGVQRTSRMRWGLTLALTLALFVVFSLGGTGALVAWYCYWPSYTAEGLLEVAPGLNPFPAVTGGYGEPEVPFQLYPSYVETQVQAIKNPRVLDAAFKEVEGKQTAYTGPGAVQALSKDLRVQSIPNTQYIYVGLRGRNREEVTRIVAQVLEQYTKQLEADRKQADAERQRGLREKRDDMQNQLGVLARRLADLRSESSLVVTDDRTSEQRERLAVSTRQLADAQLELARAKAAWDQFQKLRQDAQQGKDKAAVLMAFPEVMEALRRDPSITAMSEQVWRLKLELAGMKQGSEEKKDDIRRIEAMLQGAQNELQARQENVLGQLVQQTAATLKGAYDRARDQEASLLAAQSEARAAALAAAKLTAEYRGKEDEYNRGMALLNTLTDGLERMRISAALTRPNIRIARPPMLPLEPSEPRLYLIIYIPAVLALGLLLALGLGLLLPMILRRRSPRPEGVTAEKGGG